jgi:hypothetical protein
VAIPNLVAPGSRTWLGIAREATTGTPVLPTNTIPLDKSTYEPEDMPKFLEDLAIRGSMSHRFADVLGVEDASFSYGGPVFGDVWGFFLDNVFGDLSTTGSSPSGPATTTGSLAVAGTTTTLSASTAYTVGASAQIDVGSIAEVVVISATAASSITFASYPLRFAHTSGTTVNVVTGPYTHVFNVLNQTAGIGGTSGAQPPTHTATDYTGLTPTVGARSYPSLAVGSLDFTGNAEGLLMGKVSGNSWPSSSAASTPVNTTAFIPPVPVWRGTISIGSALTTVGEWSVSIKRELGVYFTGNGVQNPYIIARGDLDATGSVKFTVPADEGPLNLMLFNTQPATVFSATNGLSGTSQISLSISMTNTDFIKAKPVRSGVLVGYDDEFRTHANTTNVGGSGGLGQVTVTLTNNTPSY